MSTTDDWSDARKFYAERPFVSEELGADPGAIVVSIEELRQRNATKRALRRLVRAASTEEHRMAVKQELAEAVVAGAITREPRSAAAEIATAPGRKRRALDRGL